MPLLSAFLMLHDEKKFCKFITEAYFMIKIVVLFNLNYPG